MLGKGMLKNQLQRKVFSTETSLLSEIKENSGASWICKKRGHTHKVPDV